MSVGCKVVRAFKDAQGMEKFMSQEFGPLMMALLEDETNRTGVPHAFDIERFVRFWQEDNIRVIVAYDGEQAVGLMISHIYMPMFHRQITMTVEKWYAKSDDVAVDMFNYISSIQSAMGVDQIHVVEEDARPIPKSIVRNDKDSFRMVRIGD